MNEISILAEMKHPNIVQLKDVFLGEKSFYVVMELVKGEVLGEMMRKQNNFLLNDIQTIIKALFQGVLYIHRKGIMHRDLKPDNIMFSSTLDLSTLKIIDLGLAQRVGQPFIYPKCGTPGFVAPEILNYTQHSKPYSTKCDMFSIGSILYKLLTGLDLFQGEQFDDVYRLNCKCNIDLSNLILYKTPPEAKDLLEKLLEVDPCKRIDCEEALQHAFVNNKYEFDPTKIIEQRKKQLSLKRAGTVHFVQNEDQLEDEINDEMKDQINVPLISHHKKSFVMKSQIRKGEIKKNLKKIQFLKRTGSHDQNLQFKYYPSILISSNDAYFNNTLKQQDENNSSKQNQP